LGPTARRGCVVKLREEIPAAVSLDKEFALFRESEKEQTQKMIASGADA